MALINQRGGAPPVDGEVLSESVIMKVSQIGYGSVIQIFHGSKKAAIDNQ
jgi:hypothetical protein